MATCARSRAARRASRDRFPAGGSQEVFLIAFAVMTVVTMFHAKAAKISTQNARRPFQANGPVLKQYTTRSGVSSKTAPHLKVTEPAREQWVGLVVAEGRDREHDALDEGRRDDAHDPSHAMSLMA
jgi:hypothetical protein